MSASAKTETVAIEAPNSKVGSSSASTEPNNTCSRSTFEPLSQPSKAPQQQGRTVECQTRAKKQMQQVNVRASERDQQPPQRQRDQIEGRKTRVFAQRGQPGHHARQGRHQESGQQPARSHRRQRQ